MTGVTTGQTTLATATDSDDTETFLTGPLTTDLQALANLFESATGHDHTGAGKGKPIGSAGIASGITLTSPHFTGAVVDSGGLTVTAGGIIASGGITLSTGNLVVTAGNAALTAGPLTIGGTVAAAGSIRLASNVGVNWRNNANTADVGLLFDAADKLNVTTAAGNVGAVAGAAVADLLLNVNGTAYRVALKQ